jgi:hypothetical protein
MKAYRARSAERTVSLLEKFLEQYSNDAEAWYRLSVAYEWSDRFDDAIAAGERVQELGYFYRARLSYRLAQLHARTQNSEAALLWLERSLEERYEDRPEIQRDTALAALRDDPRFVELAAILPSGELTRDAGWRFDLDYLVEEARRMHAAPSRPAFSPQFESQAATLRDSIPQMTNDEVLAGMMRLLAILKDGHSAIYGPGPDSNLEFNLARLPFKFYWFTEGLYVVDGVGLASEHAGARVLRFGGLTAEQVLQRLSEYRGVDNNMTWKWMGPQFYVGQLSMLREVGATSSAESVDLTLLTPTGRQVELTIEGGDFEIQRKLRPSPAAIGETPLYLLQVGTNYWLESLPDRAALYFQFNQVRDASDRSIASFAEHLRERLVDENVTTLIVDVRHNNGGNNSLVRPLIRAMVEFELRDSEHQIFVITGRNTFSAAQNFVNRVDRWTDAVFVGEPSSASPNFVGEETNLLLPYSRVRGSVSTRYWQDSDPGDERAWIVPEIPVELTAVDYFSGRDPALEAILERLQPVPAREAEPAIGGPRSDSGC